MNPSNLTKDEAKESSSVAGATSHLPAVRVHAKEEVHVGQVEMAEIVEKFKKGEEKNRVFGGATVLDPQRAFGLSKQLDGQTLEYLVAKRKFKKAVKVVGTIKRVEEGVKKCCLCTPGSCLMNIWELVLSLLLLYTLVVLPLRLAYGVLDYDVIDYFIDGLFIIDILVNFNLPYEDLEERVWIVNRRKIAKNYIKGWFFVDLVSSFPFYIFSGSRATQLLKAPKVLKSFRVFRILKMFKAVKFSKVIRQISESPMIHPAYARMGKLLVIVILFAHFSSCTWYWLGVEVSDVDGGEGWVAYYGETPESWYVISLYWAITTLTTVGYGDIGPKTTAEKIYAIMMMIIGCSLFAYVTAALASVVQSEDDKNAMYRKKLTSLRNFIHSVGIKKSSSDMEGIELEATLLDTMATQWRELDEMRDFDWQDLIVDPHLRSIVADKIYGELIAQSSFLAEMSNHPVAFTAMVASFTPHIIPENHRIIEKDLFFSELFIITKGVADVSSSKGKDGVAAEGVSLPGDVHGLVPMFITGTWSYAVIARSVLGVYTVSLDKLIKILQEVEDNEDRDSNFFGIVQILFRLASAEADGLRKAGILKVEDPLCPQDVRAISIFLELKREAAILSRGGRPGLGLIGDPKNASGRGSSKSVSKIESINE